MRRTNPPKRKPCTASLPAGFSISGLEGGVHQSQDGSNVSKLSMV